MCAATATLPSFPGAINHPSTCCKVQLSNPVIIYIDVHLSFRVLRVGLIGGNLNGVTFTAF